MNFQMFKLDLEKAEEPEIKLPTSVGSSESERTKETFDEIEEGESNSWLKTQSSVLASTAHVLKLEPYREESMAIVLGWPEK